MYGHRYILNEMSIISFLNILVFELNVIYRRSFEYLSPY